MDNEQKLLQLSAKLYKFLESIPKGEKRDEFIQEADRQLDERGKIIELLGQDGFQLNPQNKVHLMLIELDKGILERLDTLKEEIKKDMKILQSSKKNEKQYLNPYSSVRVMDGMYYDKKK
ncbi:flagellar protein FliT [Ureibacillus endophyticus]|uniref:Flagellar protein FliT n=1 Tax=Ureibacillus endophyticus TaxID=1978490 RepID=A0A494YSI2_9BACL|nr:flagellar protein FliT [Lysinibacillus endophyticus]RKQ12841.1 flagellar protein FliT [Lysinibacillus endophyticus]